MESKEHLIVIKGKKVFYWEQNPEIKETIIILHGFPGSHTGLIDVAQALPNYRVIVPDLAGCGQSELLEEKHTLENYAAWLADFMESLALDRVTIVGYSFGSRATLVFSRQHPEKVESIILINPVLKVDSLIAYFLALHCNIAKWLPDHLRRPWLLNRIYQKMSHIILFKSSDMKRRQHIMNLGVEETRQIHHRVAMEVFDEFYHSDLINTIRDLAVKSLIIGSGSDDIVSLSAIENLAEALPGSDVQIIENAGHLFPLEEPQAAAESIQAWLAKVASVV